MRSLLHDILAYYYNEKVFVFPTIVNLFMIKRFLMLMTFLLVCCASSAETDTGEKKAKEIAKIYFASMQYIFEMQSLINQHNSRKEALFGSQFVDNVKSVYMQKFNTDSFPDENRLFIRTLLEVMVEVMEDNRTLLLDQSIGFKGFIPAIFAFQISERYSQKGIGIKVKFTNVADRVRNSFNLPDAWEINAIDKLKDGDLSEYYDPDSRYKGVSSQRYMIPVPMTPMCLSCHGSPNQNPANFGKPIEQWTSFDKTGYPMENWKLSDFGGGISVAIYNSGEMGDAY